MSADIRTVVVMAGGTGGHVFPALAVAKELMGRGVRVHWLGTRAGIEAEVVPNNQLPIEYLDVSGLRGMSRLRLLAAPFKLVRAVWQAMRLMRRIKADAVIGLGGYVTGPGGVAAKLLGLPLIVHEQNAVAGFTNRMLSRLCNWVLEAFPGSFPTDARVIWVGNPVRREIAELPAPEQRFAEHDGPVRVLVLGGSQGAVALNELVPAAFAKLPQELRPVICHQAGKKNFDKAYARYRELGVDADVRPFINDMAEVYAWADLVICRSGALTVSELAAAGLGAVLIPFPYAVDDHQTLNAAFLADQGAAKVFQQSALTADALAQTLTELLQRDRLLAMATAARSVAKPDATRLVADYCVRGKA